MTVPRFWRKITNMYNLIGTRCDNCGSCYFPPRIMCPSCRRDSKMEEYRFSGNGTLVTYTVVHSSTSDFSSQVPYALGIVRLDEGANVSAQIVCDSEDLNIGMRLKSTFRKIGEDGDKGIIYYGTKFIPV